jgi:hypothetical protein
MSYEVYVDVRHHPRHLDDWEQRESNCGKYVWEEGQPHEPLIAACLRELADRISPEGALEADERRVWTALDRELTRVLREWETSPHTQRVLFESLLRVADELGLAELKPGIRAQLERQLA